MPRRSITRWIGALTMAGALASGSAALDAIGSPSQTDDALSWSVRPLPTEEQPERPNFAFDLEPGDTIDDGIRVRNYTTEPLELGVYASDAITTVSGGIDLLPADQQSTGVGTWVDLEAATIVVPARDEIDIAFTLTVPDGAEPGDHSGGIVTSYRAPGADDSGRAVVVEHRLGSRMHVRVDGPLAPRLEVSGIDVRHDGSFNPVGTGAIEVSYTVSNIGNVRAGVEQSVTAAGRLGTPTRTAAVEPIRELLPGNSLRVTTEIDGAWPVFRTAVDVELTPVPSRAGDIFDATTPVAAVSASIWTVPWAQLAVVVLVLAAIAWFRWSRKRRGRRTAALVDQAVKDALAEQDTPPAPHQDTTALASTARHDDADADSEQSTIR